MAGRSTNNDERKSDSANGRRGRWQRSAVPARRGRFSIPENDSSGRRDSGL
jgi:hypothetical protein